MDAHRPAPISIWRHAGAVLGAALVAATVSALVAGLDAARDEPGTGMTHAVTAWLQTYVLALPSGASVFTLIFPVTRTARATGLPISVLAGAAAMTWADAAVSGHGDPPPLLAAMAGGAVIGCAYWWLACRARSSSQVEQSGASWRHVGG